MSVISNKSEKVASVVATLSARFTFDNFLLAFHTQYKNDWEKGVREYQSMSEKPSQAIATQCLSQSSTCAMPLTCI